MDAMTSSTPPPLIRYRGHVPDDVTTGAPVAPRAAMSVAVLALVVVASLCAVVGSIYLLIYFKSIKPMSARARSYKDAGGPKSDDDTSRTKSTHPFFRRK